MPTVTEHLQDCGFQFERLDHRPARTAREEADALGIDIDEIAKAVVVNTARGIAVAVVPGSRHVEIGLLREDLADESVTVASEDDVRAAFFEFDLGALPPLGWLLGVPTYIDEAILEHDTIVFASGTRDGSVRMRARDLLEEPNARVLAFSGN